MTAFCKLPGKLEIKDMDAGAPGAFTALGSTFGNEDQGGDVVDAGAFKRSLAAKTPKMLWQHDTDKVIGLWKDARETEVGLEMRGELFLSHDAHGNQNNQTAHEAYEALKHGAITDMSIGYVPLDWDRKDGVRHLKEIDLWEVSVVTFGMNELAKITGVKSRVMRGERVTKRELEEFLWDAGLSRDQAKGLVARGYTGLALRDAELDPDGALQALKQLHARIP
jgi:hypothetical protein